MLIKKFFVTLELDGKINKMNTYTINIFFLVLVIQVVCGTAKNILDCSLCI